MKKSDILKALLIIADEMGEVVSASIYESWVNVKIVTKDGAECSLEFNVLKEAEKDGN